MNQLNIAKRAQVISALVEGNSINSTTRMTGVSKPAILKFLANLGMTCEKLHYEQVRSIEVKHIQADEIWAFVYAKQKNVPVEKFGQQLGDCWTWTAIDADTKLMISYVVGLRTQEMAQDFMDDVASRVVGRPQVTTDGLKGYLKAVVNAFDGFVDHAVMQKIYGLGLDRAGGSSVSPKIAHVFRMSPQNARCALVHKKRNSTYDKTELLSSIPTPQPGFGTGFRA